MSTTVQLSINNELFEKYIFYTAVLILKTLLMIPLVGFSRIYFKAPANAEDGEAIGKLINRKSKVNRDHESVERNRRAHLNDLENIPFFIIISFLYILVTSPSVFWTTLLFRVYVVSRIAHSLLYVVFKSPLRILIYQTGILINFYMTLSVIFHFL